MREVRSMSDVGMADGVLVSDNAGQNDGVTAGTMMRVAREAAGLHVGALAVAMKIPVKKLEALESDRLELLHDSVFVRALASSVCRALKIDPAPVLAKLPLTTTPRLNADERGINAPFHKAGDVVGVSLPVLLTKPSGLIVLVLLIGVLVVYFFPEIKPSESPVELMKPQVGSTNINTLPNAGKHDAEMANGVLPDNAKIPTPVVEDRSVAATPVLAQNQVASPGLPAVPSPIGSDAALPPSRVAVSAPVAPVLSVGILGLKAKGSSWVKVVDAKGNVVLSKTMTNGETLSVSGDTPLAVVVGRADVMDVEVRGKTLSLATLAKENVARFEVR